MLDRLIERLFRSAANGGAWSTRKIGAVLKGLLVPAAVALVLRYAPELGEERAAAMVEPLISSVVAVAVALWGVIDGFLKWKERDDEDQRALDRKA